MKRLLFLLPFACLLGNNLPDPYRDLELLPFNLHENWYHNQKYICELFEENDIRTIVEVGSYCGRSTIHFASLLPEDGKLYAVDHFEGNFEMQLRKTPVLDTLYQQFLSNITHAGYTDKVIPCKMSSLEAAEFLDVKPDLIYIDAAHDTKSVFEDLHAWYPFVQGRGILCGDDWAFHSVRTAVKVFAGENDLEIFHGKHFWKLIEK